MSLRVTCPLTSPPMGSEKSMPPRIVPVVTETKAPVLLLSALLKKRLANGGTVEAPIL